MEIYTWLPNFAKWLLERNVCRVHAEDRERCREEWNADLDAFPNSLAMLIYAFRNFNSGAVNRINTDFVEAKRDEFDKNFEEVSAVYQSYVEQIHGAKLVLASTRSQREEAERQISEDLSSLKSDVLSNRKPDVQMAFQRAFSATEGFCKTLNKALDRSSDLLGVSIESSSARLGQVESMLKVVSTKRDRVVELLHNRSLAPDDLGLLSKLRNDLSEINRILKDDQWGDDASDIEYDRIMIAIDRATANMDAFKPSRPALTATPRA